MFVGVLEVPKCEALDERKRGQFGIFVDSTPIPSYLQDWDKIADQSKGFVSGLPADDNT